VRLPALMQARGPSPRTKRSERICSLTSGPLSKRGEPFTAEVAARLQEFLCLLGTILDACRRLSQLGQV
jgi:hypothetical protein